VQTQARLPIIETGKLFARFVSHHLLDLKLQDGMTTPIDQVGKKMVSFSPSEIVAHVRALLAVFT